MTGEGKQSDPFEALSISPRRGLSAGMNGRSRPPDPVAMQGPGGTKVESASRFGGKKRAKKKEAFRGEAKKWHTEEKTDIPVNQICRTITPSIPCRLRTPSRCRSFQKVPLHYMALLLSFAFFFNYYHRACRLPDLGRRVFRQPWPRPGNERGTWSEITHKPLNVPETSSFTEKVVRLKRNLSCYGTWM